MSAYYIAHFRKSVNKMTTFKQLLKDKNIKNSEAAALLEVTERTIRRWCNGEVKAPAHVIKFLEMSKEKTSV